MIKLRCLYRPKNFLTVLMISLILSFAIKRAIALDILPFGTTFVSSLFRAFQFLLKFSHSTVLPIPKKVTKSSDNTTLVFTCLGEQAFSKHQTYIWKSLRQARLISGPDLSIIVILNNASLTEPLLKKMEALNMEVVIYEDLIMKSGALILNYRDAFFIEGFMLPADNYQFNILTTERLLALHAYMNLTRKQDVFHMENDNMLYTNLTQLKYRMHECGIRLAFPRASAAEVVISFLYIHDTSSIEHFVQYITYIFRLGRSKAADFMNKTWINDMTIASRYLDTFGATKEQSESTGISYLPTQFNDSTCCLCIPRDGEEKTIFDARTLGQYFGGYYWTPNNPFRWKNDFVDPRNYSLSWKTLRKSPFRVPYIEGIRIANLHIHSKRLEKFMSDTLNQTTGFGPNLTLIHY